jgi:hypothetical protein
MNKPTSGPPNTEQAYKIIQELWGAAGHTPERRKCRRSTLNAISRVVPLDATQQPSGEPFVSVVHDISRSGVSFFHARPLTQGNFLIEFDVGDPARSPIIPQLLVRAIRCEPVRRLFLIGCEIVGKQRGQTDT